MLQQRIDSHEGVVGEISESERACNVMEGEVLPIRVRCTGNGL